MPKPLRGLMLAAGAALVSAVALADCPPEESVNRYAESSRDALSALDGLVPESQQRILEDRYSATLILKWNWQGGSAIASEPAAVAHIAACMSQGRCAAETSDLVDENATVIPGAPSARLLFWAQTELECDVDPPADIQIADSESEAENETTDPEPPAQIADPEPAAEPDTADLQIAESTPAREETSSLPDADPAEDPELQVAGTIEAPDTNRDAELQAATAASALTEFTQSIRAKTRSTALDVDLGNDPETLIKTAATLFAAGRPADALPPLRTACFIDANAQSQSQACETLFDVYNAPTERGDGAANTPAYLALSEELCAIGYNRGCQNLAQHYAGQNTAEAHRATVAYTERSCELGDGEACASVSGYYLTGRATAPDASLAREKLEQSCMLGRLRSCQEVADFYLRGVGGEVDIQKALQVNEASCPPATARRPDICVAAADFIMIHMKSGPQRSALVRTFTARACNLGHDIGCAWYAEDLELGLGGEVDLVAAKKARLTACEYGHEASCASRF